MKMIFLALVVVAQFFALASRADDHKKHDSKKHDSMKHENKHDHIKHGSELEPAATPTGGSILQLESKWKNQKGEPTQLAALLGKPRLVVMLYTKCETACPLIVEDLKKINTELNSKELQVSLFSIDSVSETPETLTAFIGKRKLPADWTLFTSDANAVAELAAALGVRYKRMPNGEYIHSNLIFFLDSKGEVVASKEGLNTSSQEFISKIRKNMKIAESSVPKGK